MKWIKRFETFINDDNRGEETQYPELNPVIKQEATEYVDNKLKSNEFVQMFAIVGIEPPVDVSSKEFDEKFDEVREKAIEYFIQNPEEMSKPVDFKKYPHNGGDGVSRTNNIGGRLRESYRPGPEESGSIKIDISEDEMRLLTQEEPLQELVRNGKITIYNKEIWFGESDKEAIDILDIYFEFDKNSLKNDNLD